MFTWPFWFIVYVEWPNPFKLLAIWFDVRQITWGKDKFWRTWGFWVPEACLTVSLTRSFVLSYNYTTLNPLGESLRSLLFDVRQIALIENKHWRTWGFRVPEVPFEQVQPVQIACNLIRRAANYLGQRQISTRMRVLSPWSNLHITQTLIKIVSAAQIPPWQSRPVIV